MFRIVKTLAKQTKFGKYLKDLKRIKRIAESESYFPEKPRKSYCQRVNDLLRWRRKWGEVHNFYNVYGQDCIGANLEEYLDYRVGYMGTRDRMNALGKTWNMSCLFEDKFLFDRMMRSVGAPTPKVFGFIQNGQVYDPDLNSISIDDLADRKDFFLKDAYGICGNLVKHVADYQSFTDLFASLPKDGAYVLQERVCQCAEENRLFPGSVNTVRLITARRRNGETYLFAKLQRIGSSISNNVDNWAAGGIAVGIEDSGCLKRWGFFKYMYGRKTETHPDTGVRFSEFKVPMLDEAIKLVVSLHRYFYNLCSIGWDVALTENGPVIIEGNENWDMALAQVCDRPLRKEYLSLSK